ncbi:RNA-binding transcriptional accessory protein, partial [Pseudonocardia sp. D17]
PAVRGVDP